MRAAIFWCIFWLGNLLHFDRIQAQNVHNGHDLHTFSGFLRNRSDSSAVAYAHVMLSDRSQFVVSDTTGFFALQVAIEDTILLSAIGFAHRELIIRRPPTQNPSIIWMKPRTYDLDVVNVYADDPMKGFFSHHRIDYGHREAPIFSPIGPVLGTSTSPTGAGKIVIEGLLTSLLLPLTSEYKQLKRLHILRRKRRLERYYERLLSKRLSVDYIQVLLPGKRHLRESFLVYWKPSLIFLEIANDSELIEAISLAKVAYKEHLLRLNSHRNYLNRITTFELRQLLDKKKE